MRYRTNVRALVDDQNRRTIDFKEFRQVVRRYKPSELLPELGRQAVRNPFGQVDLQQARILAPWGIALIARESILWGTEHRDTPVDNTAMRLLSNAHNNLYENEGTEEGADLLSLMTPLAYDQFPYQESIYEEVSRTHALLVEGLSDVETRLLNDHAWTDILGAPLDDMVGATFLIQVGANENGGWFDPAWLDAPDLQRVLQRWPRDLILKRLDQLTYTFDEFRAAYEAAPTPTTRPQRYTFNPLTARPFVHMPNGLHLAPQPQLILRTISPGGLYYAGIKAFPERDSAQFGKEFGQLTEHYVGRQLGLIEGVDVHPEVRYTKSDLSIDWFLVFPGVVVMFEVKSARFGLLQRAADGHEQHIRDKIGNAVKQLIRTHDLLDDDHPAFAHIPKDRPRIGIVTTAEPFYLANSEPARRLIGDSTFPTLVASLRDIEMLVTLRTDEVEEHLTAIANDPKRSTWDLGLALKGVKPEHKNRILEDAWTNYFRGVFRDEDTGAVNGG